MGERWCALPESVLLSPRIFTCEARSPRTGALSDCGSRMGAEVLRQVRSDTVYGGDRQSLTCCDKVMELYRRLVAQAVGRSYASQ
jgi:hypothetical protein